MLGLIYHFWAKLWWIINYKYVDLSHYGEILSRIFCFLPGSCYFCRNSTLSDAVRIRLEWASGNNEQVFESGNSFLHCPTQYKRDPVEFDRSTGIDLHSITWTSYNLRKICSPCDIITLMTLEMTSPFLEHSKSNTQQQEICTLVWIESRTAVTKYSCKNSTCDLSKMMKM